MPFDPATADALSKLGALGTVIVGIGLLITGVLRVGKLEDAQKQELREERDEWKALALDATPEIKRLNDLLSTAVALLSERRQQR